MATGFGGIAARTLILPAALTALCLGGAAAATAQELALADRGPRFLARLPASDDKAPLDVNATPVLRRRVSLTNPGATVGSLLNTLQKQTGLKLIYSADVIPVRRAMAIRAESITL